MRETENLIVGLGIAGLNLCHQLEKAGKSFIVIDNCPTNSASLIAGGIYNPLAIKRKVKSWKVDELFPMLVGTYSELEQKLNGRFLSHDFPILKPISSSDELNEWNASVNEKRLFPYVESVSEERPEGPFNQQVRGYVTIGHSGFVHIRKLLFSYREYLKDNGQLVEADFDRSQLKMTENSASYRDISAVRIVFSEGRFISENPYFNWIPFNFTKGQMLTVRVRPSLDPTRIYNHQYLLFPSEEKDVFRLGATYRWHDMSETPTKDATDELLEKVKKSLNVELEVLEEQAAVRPTVSDRRPVIGRHPKIANMFLFNGMGSKGVMLAPYFAKQLVDHIYEGTEIDPEVDLNRFGKRYANS